MKPRSDSMSLASRPTRSRAASSASSSLVGGVMAIAILLPAERRPGGSIHASITAEHAINAATPISRHAGRLSQTALRHCRICAQSNSARNTSSAERAGPAAQSGGPDPEVGGTPRGPGLACSPGMAPPMTSPLAAEEHLSQYRADDVVWHLAALTHSDCRPERYVSRLVEPPPDSGESPSSAAALSLRIFGRTCGLIGSASKSASQRSGGISGESEPNRTLSCSSVFADW